MLSYVVKTLNLFFYNMMSFSGHLVCHLGLIWCIFVRSFYVFLPNLWFGNYRVNLTRFLGHFACIQMLSLQYFFKMFGLFRPFTMCLGLFDLQMCISNRLCLFCFQNSGFFYIQCILVTL